MMIDKNKIKELGDTDKCEIGKACRQIYRGILKGNK